MTFLILKGVLQCICEKGYIKAEEISRELSIPSGLVVYAIKKLKTDQYIIPVAPLSESLCSPCPLKSNCNTKTSGIAKSYLLTEKGRELLGS